MTRDEIIKLASQAIDGTRSEVDLPVPFVLRFAALVAAAEREACANACRDYWAGLDALGEDDYQTGRGRAALDLHQAINARSIQPPEGRRLMKRSVTQSGFVEHNSGSAMNEFQSMFLTEPQPINSAAFLLAEEYNARCEAYDQKVCTGPTTRDGIQPADGRELGLISRNAIAVLADVTIKALDQGVTVDELRQAISKLL